MAIDSSFIGLRGPFMGVSCLPWRLNDGGGARSPMAVNVDCSRGSIRPRPGFSTLFRTGASSSRYKVLGIHQHVTSKGIRLLLVVTWDRTDLKTLFGVYDMSGAQIVAPADLGLTAGVPPDPYGYVTFKDVSSLPSVTIFTTPAGVVSYYSHDLFPRAPKPLKVGDVFDEAIDKSTVSYLETVPKASTIYQWGPITVYAGGTNQYLASSIAISGGRDSAIPTDELVDTRGTIRNSPGSVWLSIPGEPTNIDANSIVSVGAPVTGVGTLGSELAIFTKNSITAVSVDATGNPVGKRLLTNSVGCVNPRTVVEGRGTLSWMARDGFYQWDGSQVQKISDDIEDCFQETGWRLWPMHDLSANTLARFPFPFRVAHAQLREASGVFDPIRQMIMWSVPVTGGHNTDNAIPARVVFAYSVSMGSWSFYAGTSTSVFNPSCMSVVEDVYSPKLFFGDDWGGVNVFGGSGADRNYGATGGRSDTEVSVDWSWQSPMMEADPNTVLSVRSLRVRQKATGKTPTSNNMNWSIETDKTFDQSGTTMSFNSTMEPSPSEAPPVDTTPAHYWGSGTWGAFNWHAPGIWRERYSIHSSVVGQGFHVGFRDSAANSEGRSPEILSFDLEVQPRRDLT